MNKLTFKIGNQEVTASYDDWEALFDELENIFGLNAVEDNRNPEKLDITDCEIAFDRDIIEN